MKFFRFQTLILPLALFGLAACSSVGADTAKDDSLAAARAEEPMPTAAAIMQQHTQRRADIQQLFEKVVDSSDPKAALDWLRVYILSLVADAQARKNERAAVAGLEEHMAFLAKRNREQQSSGVGETVTDILEDVKTLKAVLGSEPGESDPTPKQ